MKRSLKSNGKDYEFHRYDGAGHGFWYYDRAIYRPEQAMDSWEKVLRLLRRQAGLGSALSALRVQPSWLYPHSQLHTKG